VGCSCESILRRTSGRPKTSLFGFMMMMTFSLVSLHSARGQVSQVDRFGIQKIYADTPPPSNSWTFMGNPRDPRFIEQRIVAADDGWFRPEDPKEMRVEVVSDPSASEKTIETFDVTKVLTKGFLFKPPDSPDGKGDFLNIEQTWRFRVLKTGTGTVGGNAHIELVPGGYRQTSGKTRSMVNGDPRREEMPNVIAGKMSSSPWRESRSAIVATT
jgi:hypothetical protein